MRNVPSMVFVSITMDWSFNSQTIRQKSSHVSVFGPIKTHVEEWASLVVLILP